MPAWNANETSCARSRAPTLVIARFACVLTVNGDRKNSAPITVKTHANRAMTKVGARDRAQLVSLAFQAGIRP